MRENVWVGIFLKKVWKQAPHHTKPPPRLRLMKKAFKGVFKHKGGAGLSNLTHLGGSLG